MFDAFLNFDSAAFQWVGEWFRPGASAILDGILKFITMLGDSGWFFILLAILFLIPNKTRKVGVIMACALVLDVLLVNVFLKEYFARPRPYDLDIAWWQQAYQMVFPNGPLAHKPHDFSFPSGHTGAAFSCMLALFFGARRKWVGRLRLWSIIGVVLAVTVGFSRLYFGVHYLTDIIAGALIGLICALIAVLAFKLLEPLYEKVNAPFKRFAEAHLPKFFW